MNDPTISAKRVRQIGEELWLLARYLEAEQGQIGWVSTCDAWSDQLGRLADQMVRAVAPPGAEPSTITDERLRELSVWLRAGTAQNEHPEGWAGAQMAADAVDTARAMLRAPFECGCLVEEYCDAHRAQVLGRVSRPGGTPE